MLTSNITDYIFKQAEIGEWHTVDIKNVESVFSLKDGSLLKVLPDKVFFLSSYSDIINKRVLDSISEEDFDISQKEEIIQEYMMNKLDFMNDRKLAISNIVNFYKSNPKFILISLENSKKSINLFLKKFIIKDNIFKFRFLEKALLLLWLYAYKNWLYEVDTNDSSFAIIDKGIKRIKKSTSLLEAIDKT